MSCHTLVFLDLIKGQLLLLFICEAPDTEYGWKGRDLFPSGHVAPLAEKTKQNNTTNTET